MQSFAIVASALTVAGAAVGFAACSSSSTAVSPGVDAGHDTGGGTNDSAPPPGSDTGAPDMGTTPETSTDAGVGEGGTLTLTVLNYKSWCAVSINGGPQAQTGATITDPGIVPGTKVTIVAKPKNGNFRIGTDPWFGVDQDDGGAAPGTDNGAGATETTTAKVTVTASHECVSVCCGDAPNGTNCPTTNPCP